MEKTMIQSNKDVPYFILDAINKISSHPKEVRRRIRRSLKTKQLCLRSCRLKKEDLEGYVIPFLLRNPDIRRLDISNNYTGDSVVALKSIPWLTEININCTDVSEVSVINLALSENLEAISAILNFGGNNHKEAALKCINEGNRIKDELFNGRKKAFMMGTHERCGKDSPILHFFKKHALREERMINNIFQYACPRKTAHLTVKVGEFDAQG